MKIDEFFTFEDPIDWDEHIKIPVKVRMRTMPALVEQMYDYSVKKAKNKWSGKIEGIGLWHFRRFLILNALYQNAVKKGNKDEINYFYKLFLAYQDRQENNYAKYGPSIHGIKHPFRNTYKHKYSNKDK